MTAKKPSTPFAALLLSLLLTGCQSLLPSPDTFVAPPPENAWRLTELAPGVRLLEYQGPRTTVSANAAYVSGSGGSVGVGINVTAPAGGGSSRRAGSRSATLPRIQAAALLVELSEAELLPVVEAASTGVTAALRPSLTLTSRRELLAAINATPFDPGVTSVGRPVDPLGIVVVDGGELSPPNPRYGALYFLENGGLQIAPQGGPEGAPEGGPEGAPPREEIRHALGGYFIVLQEGRIEGNRRQRSARSAVALTGDGERAIILAVAGGAPGTSVGLTAEEVGAWLRSLGGETGLMLDGGGSTSLAVRKGRRPVPPGAVGAMSRGGAENGEIRMAVTPSWGPTLGVERPVATLLAVRRR